MSNTHVDPTPANTPRTPTRDQRFVSDSLVRRPQHTRAVGRLNGGGRLCHECGGKGVHYTFCAKAE